MLIYTHSWELIKLVVGLGSLSLLFVMKVKNLQFESSSQKIMKTFIVVWMFQMLLWTFLCNLLEM
jgi:hypothetical protein